MSLGSRCATAVSSKRHATRPTPWITTLVTSLIVTPIATLAPPVRADQGKPQATEAAADPKRAEYVTAVENGLREFAVEHYLEARSWFLRAHELRPSARTLRGLAAVEFELRNYTKAKRLIEEALAAQDDTLTPAQRSESEELLRKTEAFVARVHLVLSPKGAAVRIDDIAVEPAELEKLIVDVGRHVFEISAQGRVTQRRQIDVEHGGALQLTFDLTPVVSAPATSVVAGRLSNGSAPPRDMAAEDDGSILSEWWFWATAGLVIAGGVVGGFLLFGDSGSEPPINGDDGKAFRL